MSALTVGRTDRGDTVGVVVDVGLRERKKQQTRDELTDVALNLFEQRGFDQVTVDEIADAAGVSPRTFFRYFGSKEAVLFSDHEEMLGVLRAAMARQPADMAPIGVVRAAVAAMAHYSADLRDQQLRRARLARTGASALAYQHNVLQPAWESAMAEALAAHLGVEVDVDLRPRLFAGVAIAVMNAVSEAVVLSGRVADIDVLLEQAFDTLANAVGND